MCPTNDNPEFDNRPRVKRTTGIPRSFLKTVDKSALQQTGEDGEEVKPPAGVMVNADGDFVIAEPDKASWEQYQAKTKSSAAAQKAASAEDKELEEKGLLCSIDKRMFIDPMKTPCCEKTYCNDCITNALIESDFVCPGCQTDGVLIDDLKVDVETSTKIQNYLKDRETLKAKERSKSPSTVNSPPQVSDKKSTPKGTPQDTPKMEQPKVQTAAPEKTKSPTSTSTAKKSPPAEAAKKSSTPTPSSDSSEARKSQETATSKKRPAEDLLENPKIPKGPKAMQRAQESKDMQSMMPQQNMNGMPGMMPNMMQFPMNNMNGFGMMMGMNPMMNPMMNMNGMFNPAAFQGMNGNGMFGGNFGGMNGAGLGNMNNPAMNGGFNNQNQPHRPNFTTPNNDNDAYFRKPVNPGRHQNRQRRVRPSDYREL